GDCRQDRGRPDEVGRHRTDLRQVVHQAHSSGKCQSQFPDDGCGEGDLQEPEQQRRLTPRARQLQPAAAWNMRVKSQHSWASMMTEESSELRCSPLYIAT